MYAYWDTTAQESLPCKLLNGLSLPKEGMVLLSGMDTRDESRPSI